jgi:histidinol-phosphatase (PHP family)
VDAVVEAKRRGMPVKLALEVGITVASDAHVPQNVGRDLDRAIDHAREAGYDTVTVFDSREAREEPLG